MTTFPEIDLPNAIVEYLKNEGETEIDPIDYYTLSPKSGRSGYADGSVINWIHSTISKPSDATLINFYDTWKNNLDADIELSGDINTVGQVRVLLKQKILSALVADTIDVAGLRSDLETIINSNSKAQTAFNRTATLWAINTTSNLNYIQVCYLLTGVAGIS